MNIEVVLSAWGNVHCRYATPHFLHRLKVFSVEHASSTGPAVMEEGGRGGGGNCNTLPV